MAKPIVDVRIINKKCYLKDWEQNQGSFVQIANHFNKVFV